MHTWVVVGVGTSTELQSEAVVGVENCTPIAVSDSAYTSVLNAKVGRSFSLAIQISAIVYICRSLYSQID